MKTYYKTDTDDLIVYNSETNLYSLKSTTEKSEMNESFFNSLNVTKISKIKFRELLNKYFKNINHEWKFEHTWFRKLDNFDDKSYDFQDRLKDIPIHYENEIYPYSLLYYQGRVVKVLTFYNGTNRCMLYNIHNGKFRGWTSINNLSPILNLGTNEYI